MLRDIGSGTTSDIPSIYQVTVQDFISLESATFQLYGFSSSFSAILHLNCIGRQ